MDALEEIYADYPAILMSRDPERITQAVDRIADRTDPAAKAMSDLLGSVRKHLSGDYRSAHGAAASAKARYKELGDDRGVIRSNIQLLMCLHALGDYTTSLELNHENLRLNEAVQDDNVTGGSYNSIGLVYRETGDYPAAIEYLEKALAIFTEQGHRPFMANVTCNIGGIYFYLDRYEDALLYLEQGVAMQREVGNVEYVVGQSLALAKVLLNLGRTDEGERLMNEMYGKAVELGSPGLIANAIIDLARHAVHQQRFEEALELLESQRSVIDPLTVWNLDRDTVYGTALANLKQYNEAKSVLNAAIERATALNFKAHIQNYHRILRDIAKEEGDFDAYIKHNDLQQKLNEELKGAEAARKMALMESEKKITALNQERERERAVLYSTLPQQVADRVIRGEEVNDNIDNAAVLFADIVGFTTHTSTMDPRETTALLEKIFTRFDEICGEHGVTKIKTIGDSYMAVSFADAHGAESTEQRAASVAVAMMRKEFYWPSATADSNSNSNRVQFRIGLHSGPVVAGVVGKERLQYDVWGDTVNVASRMESTGEPGRIQASEAFAQSCELSEQDPTIAFSKRGTINIKGKGPMTTYWLEGALA